MRVLVVNSGEPFARSATDETARTLAQALENEGHASEVLRVPFSPTPSHAIPAQAAMIRLFELTNVDRVVALDFPSYLIRHPEKVIWLIDRPPVISTLWEDQPDEQLPGIDAVNWRQVVNNADHAAFNEARAILVTSGQVRHRLRRFNGAVATVVPLPTLHADRGDESATIGQNEADWRAIVEVLAR